PAVRLGVARGLGHGRLRDGLAWVAAAARHAIFDRPAWTRACQALAPAVLALPGDEAFAVLVAALAGDDVDAATASALLDRLLGAAPEPDRRPLVAGLVAVWTRFGPDVRASLLAAALPLGVTPAVEALLGERSAIVVTRVLRSLDEGALDLDAAQRRELFAGLADHPNDAIRGAIARRLLDAGNLGHDDGDGGVGELLALPPQALVRTELDRLHAALYGGDSDAVADVARRIPPEDAPAARSALLAAIEIPNAALRRAAIEALAIVGRVTDGPALVAAARRYRAVEGTVAGTLRALGATGLAEDLAVLYQRRLKWADDDAVDDYCALAGPERVRHLLVALDTRFYPGARAGAARAIARSGAQEVVFALRAHGLSDTHDSARAAALSALQDLTGTSPPADEIAGYSLLFRSTDELDDAVDRARSAGRAALPGLRRTLAKGSWRRRRAACDVLASIPGREAEEVLVSALLDADEDVRMTAMEALLERGWAPDGAREVTLVAIASRRPELLLEHPDGIDQDAVRLALSLGGHVFRSELLDAVERLPAWRHRADDDAIFAVVRLDGEGALTHPGGLHALLRALDHTWQANPHRARLARALHAVDGDTLALELSAGGWGWRAREGLCQALALRGDDTGVAALGGLVLDEDDDVRKAAISGLVQIGTPAAAEALARGLESPFQEDRELAAAALAALGDAALPVVDRLASDPWWEGRQGAALALRGWRGDRQLAADGLVRLAVDAEYRVFQPAREGLTVHGLSPSRAAARRAVEVAQTLTVEGVEAWLGATRAADTDPELAVTLDVMVERTALDQLPQRLGLLAVFRAEHLALWLEDAATGRLTPHVGVRLAAAEALRMLLRRQCLVCHGEGAVRCPECGGSGDRPCAICHGQMVVPVPCPEPDCTARQTTRRIDSRRCATCRGRGTVLTQCVCAAATGRVACELCEQRGRIACAACGGTGGAEPRPRPPSAPA
ncbi:MAG: HEAT repeat domain-containing protein, partial [Myxococcales bacterium]|nr:HEAT repeat domain-containing protein [Myxococcales bacterium]